MTEPLVKTAMESNEAGVIDALKLAFAADPAVRWVWPEPQKYLSHFSSFARAFGGKRLQIRAPITLGVILAQPFGFHQMFTLMLIS
jgi:hypothetical protein